MTAAASQRQQYSVNQELSDIIQKNSAQNNNSRFQFVEDTIQSIARNEMSYFGEKNQVIKYTLYLPLGIRASK